MDLRFFPSSAFRPFDLLPKVSAPNEHSSSILGRWLLDVGRWMFAMSNDVVGSWVSHPFDLSSHVG